MQDLEKVYLVNHASQNSQKINKEAHKLLLKAKVQVGIRADKIGIISSKAVKEQWERCLTSKGPITILMAME